MVLSNHMNMEGVIGVYTKEDAHTKSLYILYGVQHRGQESSGITAAGDNSLRTWKGKGLVSSVFDERYRSLIHQNDYVVIGSASGENADNYYPPLESKEHNRYQFSLALDGYFPRENRTNEEIFRNTLLSELSVGKEFTKALEDAMKRHRDAYYSLVIAVWDKKNKESTLIAARDERGIRPLYMAMNEEEIFVASESAPIDVMEAMSEDIGIRKDIRPGSMIIANSKGITIKHILEPKPSHCVFEWVYFARPDSIIEGKTVHNVRQGLGHALVEIHDLQKDYGLLNQARQDIVIIPVPDSGRSVSTGVAQALGIPLDEGVIKNAYMGRTYIIDDPHFRRIASDLKHNVIKETVKNKKVIITDDSIVRGTVSESVAQNLLKAGAKEVEFLVSYAPIFYPCFSDPQDKVLAAQKYEGKRLDEIGELVASSLPSINKVRYNDEDHILEKVGLPPGNICTYCISGKNPFHQ
jgi:amidophosphoribosyltransferase